MGGKELGGGTVEVSQEGAVTEVVQLVANNRNSKEIPTERTDTLRERSAGGLPGTGHDGEAMRPGTETRDESDVKSTLLTDTNASLTITTAAATPPNVCTLNH